MDRWNLLSAEEKSILACKFGLSRGGANNDLVSAEELKKIPEGVLPEVVGVEVKAPKKARKAKKVVKE